MRVPVLIFETNPSNIELLNTVLTRKNIAHAPYLVPLRKGVVPPPGEYFRSILERYRPQLLITSWRHIGPAVKATTRVMTEPRPVEKWVVSGYQPRFLEEVGASAWANEIFGKPISPLYLAEEVEKCLLRLRTSAIVV
jgi:hypothetical protein